MDHVDHEFQNLSAEEWLILTKVLTAYRQNKRFGASPWIYLTPLCLDGRPDLPIIVPQALKPIAHNPKKFTSVNEADTPCLSPSSTDNGVSANGVSAGLDLGATCREAIQALLAAEKRRMTSGEIYQWLEDHTKSYTKPTVIKTLSLMQNDGEIDNDKDDHGKGYGLCAWKKEHGIIGT